MARAGGGEIVRARKLDANTATIGRGTDCDIQLPDLAVYLRHATITLIEPDALAVQAIGDAPFDLNGRNVTQARFTLADKPTLIFGSHTLSITAGSEHDEAVITISRQAGIAEPADQIRLRRIFSLGPTLFSTRRAAWILGLAILLGCLVAPIGVHYWGWGAAKIHPDRQWSTGPLSAGHAFLAHDCQACHQQAFVSVRDSACLACHRANLDRKSQIRIAANVRALGSPFAPIPAHDHASAARLMRAGIDPADMGQEISAVFARLFDHPAQSCAECHTEHVGMAGQVVRRDGAARVGHAQLKTLDCVSCHRVIHERLPDSIVFDVPGWARHPDFRPVIFVSSQGRQRRAALGDIPHEYSGLSFSHWQHLKDPAVTQAAAKLGPERYNAPLVCSNCHALAGDGRSFVPLDMPHNCSACHDLKYALGDDGQPRMLKHGYPDDVVKQMHDALVSLPQMNVSGVGVARRRPGYVGDTGRDDISGVRLLSPELVNAAIRSVFKQGGLCYGCHAFVQPNGPQSLVYRVTPIRLASRYLPWSAFDHGVPAHRQDAQGRATCVNCHRLIGSKNSSFMTLPHVSECRTCHGAARSATATPASSDCMDCHGYHVADRPLSAAFDNLRRTRMSRAAPTSDETQSGAP